MRFPLPHKAEPEAVAAGINPGMASWLPLTARQAEAGVVGTVLIFDGQAPGIVIDLVWGTVAEAAFHALAGSGPGKDEADIKYVQIGSLAGYEASVPAALLRSRRLTISGSGAG